MVTERSAREGARPRAAEPLVLVVDDDEDLADTCRYWLDGERYAVETAYGGTEALARLDDTVDVVLLDRRMPNVSGDDVLDEIRERGLDCRVAMMTAVEPDTDIVDMPFDAYLVKPVTESEVRETVDELLVRADFEHEVREYFALESTEAALEERDADELRDPAVLDDLRRRLEAVRAEHEAAIENRERQLDHLTRVNDLIRDVDRAIVDARSREEIERTVCESVADTHEAACIARRTTSSGALRCTAVSGTDRDPGDVDLSPVDELYDGDAAPDEVRFVESVSETHRRAVFDGRADELSGVAALTVPLVYRDTVYGVLVIYDDARRFAGDTAVFADLGATIGNGINAAESKRLLNGDTVVELVFELGPDADTLAGLSRTVGFDLSLDSVAQVDDTATCFVTVEGAPADEVVDAAATRSSIANVRVVSEGRDESVLEIRVIDESMLIAAVDYGASVDSFELEDGEGTLVVTVAPDADHGVIAEGVTGASPNATVVAKREVERTEQSSDSFRHQLDGKLTDRQKTVLETALVSGYFDWPRGSTAEEVADALGISPPTLHEHLRTAERKLMQTYFEE